MKGMKKPFAMLAFISAHPQRRFNVPDDHEKIQWAVDNASDRLLLGMAPTPRM